MVFVPPRDAYPDSGTRDGGKSALIMDIFLITLIPIPTYSLLITVRFVTYY